MPASAGSVRRLAGHPWHEWVTLPVTASFRCSAEHMVASMQVFHPLLTLFWFRISVVVVNKYAMKV